MTTTRPADDVASISFRNLTKRYGSVTALEDFSVDVAPGRIGAFLGANGSGKTTSMRVLLASPIRARDAPWSAAAATPNSTSR